MPSTQVPPLGGSATDPTLLRPPIDDAEIERVELGNLHARLAELQSQGFTMLLDLGAVDYPERAARFDIVYHLLAIPANAQGIVTPRRVRVLCAIGLDVAAPSVTDLWKSADWAEREVYDLFGITFAGHPDLRRIQMPHEWEGYPLRKDYPVRGLDRERAPRPPFALKSNVTAGTPPSGRTLEALQEEVKRVRSEAGA